MFKHIQKNNKLLVVSDTGMILNPNGGVNAFGPVVKELNHFLLEFDEITWIGFHRKQETQNKSYLYIENDRIKPILLKEVGGKGLLAKLKIVFYYPKMIFIIWNEILKHKYIHSRSPSNPSVIVMFLSLFFKEKNFWFKYAGSWIDDASFFYKVQRSFLKVLKKNSIITINGDWKNQGKNIISFENPCLEEVDRELGRELIGNKTISNKIIYCFVGALNSNKGAKIIIEAFSQINTNKVIEIHFIGDGHNKEKYIDLAKSIQYKTKFYGFLAKDQIREVYIKSHFIILPSKSEGFPKVIAEAMNYGCIPIVSDISCIGQYIERNKNGFLLSSPTINVLKMELENSFQLDVNSYIKWIKENYAMTQKFTYNYYIVRMKKEIFNL